jgi:hypothetical protein
VKLTGIDVGLAGVTGGVDQKIALFGAEKHSKSSRISIV